MHLERSIGREAEAGASRFDERGGAAVTVDYLHDYIIGARFDVASTKIPEPRGKGVTAGEQRFAMALITVDGDDDLCWRIARSVDRDSNGFAGRSRRWRRGDS